MSTLKSFTSKKGNYSVVMENVIGTGYLEEIENVINVQISLIKRIAKQLNNPGMIQVMKYQ